jgi:hypothetical protein
MRTRRMFVPVTYYHASPHAVVVGLRRCPPYRAGDEAAVLRAIAEEGDGWQALSLCHQKPVRWGRGCVLRPVLEIAGSVARDLPRDVWHPVGS